MSNMEFDAHNVTSLTNPPIFPTSEKNTPNNKLHKSLGPFPSFNQSA